jgi:hypothetical protein
MAAVCSSEEQIKLIFKRELMPAAENTTVKGPVTFYIYSLLQ